MVRCLLPAVIAAAALWPSASATAGVLTAGSICSSSGGCEVSLDYRASRSEANRVTATTATGALGFSDGGARIDNATHGYCVSRDPHAVICKQGADYLSVEGGNGGDVIDTRGFRGNTHLTGGKGNDKLYVAGSPGFSFSQLTGRGGHNLLVGDSTTTVSYKGTRGAVTVDLAKGIGIAPGERDRIVSVRSVIGGDGTNHLYGSRFPHGTITGGAGKNYLVAHAPYTSIYISRPHKPSTIVCPKTSTVPPSPSHVPPTTFVQPPGHYDLLEGPCRLPDIQLLTQRALTSPVLEVLPNIDLEEVVIHALPSRAVLGQIDIPPGQVPGFSGHAYSRLNRRGQRLLRSARRLHVRIDIHYRPLLKTPPGLPPRPAYMLVFRTILNRPPH